MSDKALWESFNSNPLEVYARGASQLKQGGIDGPPNLGRVLDVLSPTEKAGDLDAFGRMMREAGIRTHTDRFAGVYASEARDFLQSDGTRALMVEFFRRNWMKASGHTAEQRRRWSEDARSVLLSSDSVLGSWDRPYAEASSERWQSKVAAAIPLSEVVGQTTPSSSMGYKSSYISYDANQLRKFRVGESTDIPIADITQADQAINLRKFGRGIRASYEALSDMRADKLAWFVQFVAVQSEMDKVAAALDVLVSGDGNNNAAATHNLTALDTSAQAGTLTLKGWLAFKMKFAQPYTVTTALMTEAIALQLVMLNTGSANVPLVAANLGGLGTNATPINQFADGVRYGWTSDAPANKIVAFDRRMGLEHVIKAGSQISESDRFITNQTQVLVMSEIEGFAVLDKSATRVLVVDA